MKMNSITAVAAVLTGLLEFRHNEEAKISAAESEAALKRVKDPSAPELPEHELEGEEWMTRFGEYLSDQGLEALAARAGSNARCYAALNPGEPAFTLRGQDMLASTLVRHWANLASLSGECPQGKIDNADEIAEKMEEYQPQKWPD